MPAVLLVASLVAFRGRAWFVPYGDASSGLYLHIAAAMLGGHLPYTTAWDYRPPGLFALYAAALALFGPRFAWNGLTTLALVATAIAVGLLGRQTARRDATRTGWCAAAFFALLAPENDGIWGNAEIEISAFVAWSLWLATLERGAWWAAASGVLGACALECKLSAIAPALLPALVVALRKGTPRRRAVRALAFAAGFALPLAFTAVAYQQAGDLALLWFATFDASFRRAHALSFTYYRGNARWLVAQLRILAPQIEFAAFARPARGPYALAAWGWLLAAAFSVLSEGEFFHYQFALLTAPAALLGALGFMQVVGRAPNALVRRAVWAAAFALTFVLHDYYEAVQGARFAYHRLVLHDAAWRNDQTSAAIAALRAVAPDERSLLLIGISPFVYDVLGVPAPTRFTAPVIWLDPRLTDMAGPSARGELERLIALRPNVVAVSSLSDPTYAPARVARIRSWLKSEYQRVLTAPDFTIWRVTNRSARGTPRASR